MPSANSTTTSSVSAAQQSQKIPYFPPPPTAPTTDEERKKKPSRKGKPPLPSIKPRQRRSSPRHTVGFSTQSRRKRLQEVHLPAIKLSPRHWLLVGLLLLSFLVLILDFIFADCVALPHTDRKDNFASETPIADSVTLYTRQLQTGIEKGSDNGIGYDKSGNIPNAGTGAPNSLPAGSVPGASAANATTSPSEYLANESKRLGFDSPKNLAILFFYAATLPGLTIIHTIAELVLLYCSKRRRSANPADEESKPDKDNESDSDSIASLKKRPSSMASSSPKLPWLLTFLPAISLTISTLLTLGWITINTIQYHCEIHPLSHSSTNAICPIQTRGHFMSGIHELSIAKNVMGWILVAVYIAYVGWCARVSGLVWRAGREERKERQWMQEMEKERVKHLRLQVNGGRAEIVAFHPDVSVRGDGEEEEGKQEVATVNVKEVR